MLARSAFPARAAAASKSGTGPALTRPHRVHPPWAARAAEASRSGAGAALTRGRERRALRGCSRAARAAPCWTRQVPVRRSQRRRWAPVQRPACARAPSVWRLLRCGPAALMRCPPSSVGCCRPQRARAKGAPVASAMTCSGGCVGGTRQAAAAWLLAAGAAARHLPSKLSRRPASCNQHIESTYCTRPPRHAVAPWQHRARLAICPAEHPCRARQAVRIIKVARTLWAMMRCTACTPCKGGREGGGDAAQRGGGGGGALRMRVLRRARARDRAGLRGVRQLHPLLHRHRRAP